MASAYEISTHVTIEALLSEPAGIFTIKEHENGTEGFLCANIAAHASQKRI